MEHTDQITRSCVIPTRRGLKYRWQEARLLVEAGPDRGREFVLSDRPQVAGRSKDCAICLRDPSISRRHLQFSSDSEGWRVRDLESKRGSFLEGLRIVEARLQPGQTLVLGETHLRFEVADRELLGGVSEKNEWFGQIAHSKAMREIFGLIERLAPTPLSVLVEGETGVGKEGIARSLHLASGRPRDRFQVVDSTLLRGEHLRSELFGHTKGAFTGATKDRPGAFRKADQGTLFFDEIGELPLEHQATLLRVLETGEVQPLGGTASSKVSVRVVSATNRDLEQEVAQGRFRADLFFRLSSVRIRVPPLRERAPDILPLAEHFLSPGVGLSASAQEALEASSWPGNVRELKAKIETACALARGATLSREDLLLSPGGSHSASPGSEAAALRPPSLDLKAQEKLVLERALELAGGNRKEAAQALGMPLSTLYRKLKKLGIG